MDRLWQSVRAFRSYPDERVNIKFVSEEEIRTLNRTYRGRDEATNVLTFSYRADVDHPSVPHARVTSPSQGEESQKLPPPYEGGEPERQRGEGVEHDIAVCLAVAEREAEERGVKLKDYVALLLVHAFLHATGLDHEESERKAEEMRKAEREILKRAGFSAKNL